MFRIFPKPGILFKDITPVLADGRLLAGTIDLLVNNFQPPAPWMPLWALTPAASFSPPPPPTNSNAPSSPCARKANSLSPPTRKATTWNTARTPIAIHTDAITPGSRVLLIDDLLATGGTAAAAANLLNHLGVTILEITFLIELSFLNGRDKLKGFPVRSLVVY